MKLNQKGAVALLTVVIFSIIITIVATAYSRIAVVQQQESINFDLSTRAYYAAEAGVQDAIRELRGSGTLKDDGRPNDCGEDLNDTVVEVDGTSSDLAYTCQLIEVSPSDVVAETYISKAVLFEVIPKEEPIASNNYYIEVYWSKQPATEDFVPRNDYPSKLFPKRADWLGDGGVKVHPLMRTVFVRVGGSASLTRDSFKQNTFFLNPTKDGEPGPPLTLNFGASPQERSTAILNTRCVASNGTPLTDGDGYSCMQRIKINSSEFNDDKRVFIAFTSEYGTTDIKFKFTGGKGGTIGPIELKNSQAVIDVTAKAGSVFRRVQQRVPLSNNYSESDFSADALVAGDGICKHFIVTSNENDYKENCVVSTPPVE